MGAVVGGVNLWVLLCYGNLWVLLKVGTAGGDSGWLVGGSHTLPPTRFLQTPTFPTSCLVLAETWEFVSIQNFST